MSIRARAPGNLGSWELTAQYAIGVDGNFESQATSIASAELMEEDEAIVISFVVPYVVHTSILQLAFEFESIGGAQATVAHVGGVAVFVEHGE